MTKFWIRSQGTPLIQAADPIARIGQLFKLIQGTDSFG